MILTFLLISIAFGMDNKMTDNDHQEKDITDVNQEKTTELNKEIHDKAEEFNPELLDRKLLPIANDGKTALNKENDSIELKGSTKLQIDEDEELDLFDEKAASSMNTQIANAQSNILKREEDKSNEQEQKQLIDKNKIENVFGSGVAQTAVLAHNAVKNFKAKSSGKNESQNDKEKIFDLQDKIKEVEETLNFKNTEIYSNLR